MKLEKGDFVGRDALAKQKAEGLNGKLAGFVMLGRDIARDHYPVYVNGMEVSHVTSGSPSITLKQNIGLTYLPLRTRLSVQSSRFPFAAALARLKLFKRLFTNGRTHEPRRSAVHQGTRMASDRRRYRAPSVSPTTHRMNSAMSCSSNSRKWAPKWKPENHSGRLNL